MGSRGGLQEFLLKLLLISKLSSERISRLDDLQLPSTFYLLFPSAQLLRTAAPFRGDVVSGPSLPCSSVAQFSLLVYVFVYRLFDLNLDL